jgi:cytosine/adenosine deaminase-related metal-dependent hydrolase
MLGADHVLIVSTDGKVVDLVNTSNAGDDIQHFSGMLCPGFINSHCHLELSHMRELIPEHTGLVDFVFKIVTERHHPEEAIAAAIDRAEQEMLQNGIVAVGDICNNISTLAQKKLNNLSYHNFIEISGWNPSIAQTRFERAKEIYRSFYEISPTKNRIAISPHAPYSVSEQLWSIITPDFADRTITIHNQETSFEDALFINGSGDFKRMYQLMQLDTSFYRPTGKSSLQSYFHHLQPAEQVLLVHNTFSSEDDIAFANDLHSHVNWCICINANQYIENAVPPINLLRKLQSNIVVGTDSLASNHSLSILDELKTISHFFSEIPLAELLQWATINGAKALQMDDRLGSFEKGKTPGVLLIENINQQQNLSDAKVKRLV